MIPCEYVDEHRLQLDATGYILIADCMPTSILLSVASWLISQKSLKLRKRHLT